MFEKSVLLTQFYIRQSTLTVNLSKCNPTYNEAQLCAPSTHLTVNC